MTEAPCHPERSAQRGVEGSRAASADGPSGLAARTRSFGSASSGRSAQDGKWVGAPSGRSAQDGKGTCGFAACAQDGRRRLSLPLDRAALATLEAGDACLLTGPLYTLRDAGHVRLMAELEAAGGSLPYGLDGQALFYAGPTPAAAGRPFGAVGPTTASRMDFAAPALHRAGIAATVGKGRRSPDVRAACVETGSVYFVACGGAAAYLAKCVASSKTVAYGDLGTEALRRIEVVDFPVFVGIDVRGRDVYDLV